jgi:hypothetical protein
VKLSKLIPIWMLVLAIALSIISLVLKARHDAIVKAYNPSSAIESMKIADSVGSVTTLIYVITIGLWIVILLMVLFRIGKQEG